MAIEVSWDNVEKTCLRYDLDGPWSLTDLEATREDVRILLTESSACNCIIVDLTGSKFVPSNLLRYFGQRGYSKPLNLECLIFVGSNKLVEALTQTFQKIYKNQSFVWELVDSMAEARTIAAQFATQPQPVEDH